MTQANEPCRQEGEGARRRQWRGSDIRGTCFVHQPCQRRFPGARLHLEVLSLRNLGIGLVTGTPVSPTASLPPTVSARSHPGGTHLGHGTLEKSP